MTLQALAAFLALTAFAAYIQTITGFAFGLILITGVALGDIMPLPDAAVLVSTLTLANASTMLSRGWRRIAWREWRLCVFASVPSIFVGLALLDWLASERIDLLRLCLALSIAATSLAVLRTPRRGAGPPRGWTYALAGVGSGVMTGLFAAGGPPLVFRFYMSSLPIQTIRETLVSIYALNAVIRLGGVFASGHAPAASLWWGLLAFPAVMATTAAARRWPPPIASSTLRAVVVVLLLASALSLGLPALPRLFGG